MAKKPELCDPTGRPIGDQSSETDPLPAGVQALIETRVNAAIADIREHNRDDLQDLARDQVKKWRILAYMSTTLFVATTFFAPFQILKWVAAQVDKGLTEPRLRESADRVIEARMSEYVDKRIQPLRDQASTVRASLESIRGEVKSKQEALGKEQRVLSKQLRITELAVAAKAGSRPAYRQLLALQNDQDQPVDLVKASLREIQLFFDADRNQTCFPGLAVASDPEHPTCAVDEVIYVLRSSPPLAEAAVNTLGCLRSKGCVGELCRLAEQSDDLRVAARCTRALQAITGEDFWPLEFDKVAKWWSEHSSNSAYSGSYDGYIKVRDAMWNPSNTTQTLVAFVEELQATAASDPDALHSRCLQAGFLLMLDKDERARQLLEAVRTKRKDYYSLHLWDAAVNAKAKNTREAVRLINLAFSKGPTEEVEKTVRGWTIFAPVKDDDGITWPSRKKEDAQQ